MIPRPIDLRLPRSFTALAVGLGSAAIAGPTVRAVFPESMFFGIDHALLWSVGLATALCSVLATAIVFRRGALAQGRGALRWYGAAAIVASGMAFFALAGLQGELNLLFILAGAMGGAAIAAPLGVLFGVASMPALLSFERLRRNPSLAGRRAHIAGVSAWLVGAGLLASAIATNPVTDAFAWTCIVVGAVAAFGAGLSHAIHARWIGFVAANRVPGWTIRDPNDVHVPLGLARWSDRPDPYGQRPGILCRVVGSEQFEAHARIPAVMIAARP